MNDNQTIDWLLEGDISIQYQVYRDLLGNDRKDLRNKIEHQGWGKLFLSYRRSNGHWGRGFYQPKWTSTHYTLLDLRNLCISPDNHRIRETIDMILREDKGSDGGLNPSGTISKSDVCINGMALNYASYFRADQDALQSIVDFMLSQRMGDGGFNCRLNRSGARHSSLHTTISAVEGILEYSRNGYTYRSDELKDAEKSCREFMLQHRLFKSHRTGEIIDKKMTMLSYPCRWRYDALRALDYFQQANVHHDKRMDDAIELLMNKRGKDGTWPVQAKHPGATHFDMERAGKASRWNTLRALRVLRQLGG